MTTQEELKYQEAQKQEKKIKGFYTHLIVFILVNIYVIIKKTKNIDEGETIWHAFKLAFFWGIGLVFHGLKTFDLIPYFGKNWEERKIKEILDKEKNQESRFQQ
jgi:hypothetical protein